MATIIGLVVLLSLLIIVYLILMEFTFFENLFQMIKESIFQEVLYGDKKDVKEGKAVYITCDTYMTLHEAKPKSYPIYPDTPNWTFVKAKDDHSVVFRVKEANKLRRILKAEKKKIDVQKNSAYEEKRKKQLHDERIKALKDIERMRKDIIEYSKEKDRELGVTIAEQRELVNQVQNGV